MTAPPFWERALTIKVDHEALQHMHAKQVDITQRINGIPGLDLTLMRRSTGLVGRWDQVNADAERCAPGKTITLKLVGPDGQGDVILFDGIVVAQRISWDGPNPEITVKAVHPLQKLIGQPRSRVHHGMTDQAVITELIGAHAAAGHIDVAGPEHEQLLQWQSTDWYWLRRRMRACGVWLLPHMDRVDCAAPLLSHGKVHQIIGDGARTDGVTQIAGAEWHVDNRALAARIDGSCWNVGEQRIASWTRAKPTKLGTGGLDPGRVKALTTEPWQFFDAVPLTSEEVQRKVDGQLMAQEMAAAQARIVLYADAQTVKYRLGETIEISGLGSRQNGRAIISGIRHQWQHGSFMTTVYIGMDDRAPIDAAALPNASALTVGKVAKYESDQKQFDRIRITLPALGEEVIWARFAKPYASTRRGFHFYPDPDDEVLVSFIEDDPRFPVVLGATHNPVNVAPAAGDQRETPWTWKGWVSADEKGKTLTAIHFADQGICLETPTGVLAVGVGPEGKEVRTNVRVEEAGLTANASAITISATDKMIVEGVSTLDLIGAKIDLKNKR